MASFIPCISPEHLNKVKKFLVAGLFSNPLLSVVLAKVNDFAQNE